MAKPIMSSNLKSMKFMQRASQREENLKMEEDEVVIPNGNFPSCAAIKKCVVIMEGNPHPGAIKGRMSFLSFNPSIDKLNDEASNSEQTEASATFSGRKGETMSDRSNGSPKDGHENIKPESSSPAANGDHKRKQEEEVSEAQQYPNKSPRNLKSERESSGHNNRSWQKQPKNEKLDWNVLRPPKSQKNKKKR